MAKSRITPAWAGNRKAAWNDLGGITDHPRVGGE